MEAPPEGTLWGALTRRAVDEREAVAAGRSTVDRASLEPEVTPFGVLRWYLHGDLMEPVTRSLYVCELEIPRGSRSGRLRHQGGIVHLVVEGRGYTIFDGAEHAWEKGDVIAIPTRPDGMEFQHVNDGAGPVRMVMAWPNFDSALGPEAGVAMEVLDPAPEWVARG